MHTPRVSDASDAGTIQADFSPMAAFHASPSEPASFASHIRAVSENEYAEIKPRPRISEDAGQSAPGTSPSLATPAGIARTPAPSAALHVLKIVVVMLESPPSDDEATAGVSLTPGRTRTPHRCI